MPGLVQMGGYGKEPAFLRGLKAMGGVFVVDIHKDQQIYLEDPQPIIPESASADSATMRRSVEQRSI